MRSGTCPKCQGEDIIRVHAQGGVHGNGVMVGLRAVPITRYVCFACGFTEEWIESRADLERLKAKYGYERDDPARPEPGVSIEQQLGFS